MTGTTSPGRTRREQDGCTAARIAAVLAARRAGLPTPTDAVDRRQRIGTLLGQFDGALAALCAQPRCPNRRGSR